MGRCQRSKGTKETTLWLSLGTSWCWEQVSQGGIPFHRQASQQSLGSGKLSRSRGSGTWGFRLSLLPRWSHIIPACPPPYFQGHSRESRAASESSEGFLSFTGFRISMREGQSRTPLPVTGHGNSNTSGKTEASLDPIMASTPPLASMRVWRPPSLPTPEHSRAQAGSGIL